jgi:hypothetical protein
MPENPNPATQSEPGAAPELDFSKPETENPRIKRRSLKAKQAGSLKPAAGVPDAARDLEREAPPLPAEQAKPATPKVTPGASAPTVGAKAHTAPSAPPRVTPTTSTKPVQPSIGVAAQKVGVKTASAASQTASPHGTRPATLYYSTYPRKDKEAPAPTPMKTTHTASPSPASSSSTTTSSSAIPTSVTRTATATPRTAPQIDYRTNVERQSREQKSVGNILAYVVYGLIAFIVLGVALAGYGANVIFERIHDQSVTVSDLDQKYAQANQELLSKLATTQQALVEAQAQANRQQDVIVKQQDAINRLIAASDASADAIRQEKSTRTQETAALRARVRDIEYRTTNTTTTQKY